MRAARAWLACAMQDELATRHKNADTVVVGRSIVDETR